MQGCKDVKGHRNKNLFGPAVYKDFLGGKSSK